MAQLLRHRLGIKRVWVQIPVWAVAFFSNCPYIVLRVESKAVLTLTWKPAATCTLNVYAIKNPLQLTHTALAKFCWNSASVINKWAGWVISLTAGFCQPQQQKKKGQLKFSSKEVPAQFDQYTSKPQCKVFVVWNTGMAAACQCAQFVFARSGKKKVSKTVNRNYASNEVVMAESQDAVQSPKVNSDPWQHFAFKKRKVDCVCVRLSVIWIVKPWFNEEPDASSILMKQIPVQWRNKYQYCTGTVFPASMQSYLPKTSTEHSM